VYYDEPSGLLLMVTHHEDYSQDIAPGDTPMVSLRMASSANWGANWTDMGKIISHNKQSYSGDKAMGNGGFLIVQSEGTSYMYVYHADVQANNVKHQLAVSRCKLSLIVAAASGRTTPVFNKWNGADWSQPALGGASIDLMPNMAHWEEGGFGVVGDFDPLWSEDLQSYVAFYPTQIKGDVVPPTWNVYVVLSKNGIRWEHPRQVYPQDLSGGDPIYTGVEAHNRIVVSERPKLYRLYCNGLNDSVPGLTRWETSTLELVTLEKYEIDLTLPGFHRSPPLFVD